MAEEAAGAAVVRVQPEPLREFCAEVFQRLGVPRVDAEITADTMLAANLRGVDTHGVMRVVFYANKIRGGVVNPRVDLTPVKETAATALLDGKDGLGQVIAYRAMDLAIRKAKEAGSCFVTVRNSNHLGMCAYYSMMALPHDMIGFTTTNASPRLAPTGGVERLLGNNPWCFAVPAGRRPPVVLDLANSVVAAGKIRIAQKEGRRIPDTWALNKHGEPTTDPQEALQGILLAIGGYKGYGITLMMDMLTGVLSDSAYGPRVAGLDNVSDFAHVSHSFMALDISAVADVAAFKARMDSYIDEIKSSRKARGAEVIYLPGEIEFLKEQERREKGIPLQPKVAEELRAVGAECGVRPNF